MKSICWAYDDDERICRRPAVVLDPQRGFMVCHEHRGFRETKTENETSVMSKTRPPP